VEFLNSVGLIEDLAMLLGHNNTNTTWQHYAPWVKSRQIRLDSAVESGERLPYKVVVITGATGPKLDGLSERPGVIYYCVSADYQQFWATMTGLAEDVSPKATLKRVGDRSYDEPWLVAGSGKAITAHNP
jgi:hypothetical protein